MRVLGFVLFVCFATSASAQDLPPPPSSEQAHRAQVFQQVQRKQARILRRAAAKVKAAYASVVQTVPFGALLVKPVCASLESDFQAEFKNCRFMFEVPATRISQRAVVTLQADIHVDIKATQDAPGKKHSRTNNGTSTQFVISTGVVSVAPGSLVPALQAGIVVNARPNREAYARTVADQHESGTFTSFQEENDPEITDPFDACGEVEALPDFSRERGVEAKCYSYLGDDRFQAQMLVLYQKDVANRIIGVRAVGFGGNF